MASRSRVLLVSALGGLLLLTAATGATGLFVLGHARSNQVDLQRRYLERSGALERVREAIYLSGALTGDYLTDPHGPAASDLKLRLHALASGSRRELERSGATASLRGEVTAYWRFLDLMMDMADRRPTALLETYFRGQLVQRRETMLRMADSIGSAVGKEWRDREDEMERMYDRFRNVLRGELLLVVLAGAAVAAATVRRMLKLEGETRALGGQLVRAQEEERRSIARELHDEVGQSLTALRLDLGAAAAGSDGDDGRARLESAAATVERIVEEVRRIALSLRPSMLDDLGLVAALEWQAREISDRTGLKVEVDAAESAGQLPDALRTCIYRVAQEALQNCARHSGAGQVSIGLEKNGATVRLKVQDDGRGFRTERTRGLGLLGMEERVAQLGGRLRLISVVGSGTTVIADLPV